MILVKPSFEILTHTEDALKLMERAGRTCYKSEDKITDDSADKFVRMVSSRGHLSVVEHATMTVKFVCDRGVTHELVRHRLAAYSQESTRYCCYSKSKFGNQITVVIPPWYDLQPAEYVDDDSVKVKLLSTNVSSTASNWLNAMRQAEIHYIRAITNGESSQQARSMLPNSLKTEIVMTANFREWIHVFNLRCSQSAHPQIVEIMTPLRDECRKKWPAVFGKPE